MRPIKFRGKRVDNGQWIYGYLINDYNTGEGFYIAENLYHVDGAEFNIDVYKVVTESVGQLVGLLDKNGKEVWEGDIVTAARMHHGKPGTPFTAKIDYNEHIGAYQISYKNIYDAFVNDEIYFRYQIEVIGNIYENPELLK